jgi:signal recognition particle subunit SRP54
MKHIQEGIFTVRDLRDQLGNIMKMGPLSKMAGMIPGLSQMMGDVGDEEGSMKLKRMMFVLLQSVVATLILTSSLAISWTP